MIKHSDFQFFGKNTPLLVDDQVYNFLVHLVSDYSFWVQK